MAITYAQPIPQQNRPSAFAQVLAALAGGVLIFASVLVLALTVYNVRYFGHIFPGVSVAGVDVSGLTREQASVRLTDSLTYPNTGKVVLADGDKVWVAAPVQMGMVLDAQATAENAYRAGRSSGIFQSLGDQFRAFRSGKDVAPVMILDERTGQSYLKAIAAQADIPVMEATLAIHGSQVDSKPGQIGRLVDVDATLQQVSAQMQTFTDGVVPLVIKEEAPLVIDASKQAEAARRVLSGPFALTLPSPAEGDPGPWTIPPEMLGSMLVIKHVDSTAGGEYELSVNEQSMEQQLNGIADVVNRAAANARFSFNDDTHQLDLLQPAQEGRTVKVAESIAAIDAALNQGNQSVALALAVEQPAVTSDATAASLGITELIHEEASYFYGSSSPRIQNIKAAAARFHGLLIAPGETFSMGNALGDVSLDNGFAEAMIIYGNRTIKGIGGGVCQVSTTLFRAAFFTGFPVVERVPHAYRVSYYEETPSGGHDPSLAGLDATVYTPLVDLKFTNDTPYWLLMETYVNEGARRITWKFYSTSDGRSVTWDTTGPQNRVPAPEAKFEESPDLGKGEMKQVDWAAEGADVYVTRTVMRDGRLLFNDDFSTHYAPWQAICQYGPGTEHIRSLAREQGLCQP
jgi:vancomycin resistance protein YoaR